MLPEHMIYWLTIGINCQTAMMAVCGWEPNHMSQMEQRDGGGWKGPPLAQQKCWAYLWVHYRGNWTVCQKVIGKCHIWQDVEWSCQACSCQAGHTTSSMFHLGSRVDYCPVIWNIRAVYTAWLIVWHSKSTDKAKQRCHDRRWASETCSWLKQTPWWHRCHRQWTNILVHLPITMHDGGVPLLVGEGVRYHISYS